MVLFFYRSLIFPLMLLSYLMVAIFHPKVRKLLMLRFQEKRHRPSRVDGPWIWVHASSGEFEYAKALLRKIKETSPRDRIVVTYSSPSYAKQIQESGLADHAEPLPFDLPGPLSEFMAFFQPKLVLIARTDLWPEMLFQCKKRNIKTVLFAVSFPKSLGKFELFVKQWIFSFLDCLLVVKDSDLAMATKGLGFQGEIRVLGDPRFDQALFRIQQVTGLRLEGQHPLLVAGSTWPEDEAILLEACSELLRSKALQLWVAPHEPTEKHLSGLTRRLSKMNIDFQSYSEIRHPSKVTAPVLIVDTLGVLADLYSNADFAFVGGSFKKKVHSVMEPLVSGCPVMVGPHHQNNREAVDFSKVKVSDELFAVNVVKSSAEVNHIIGQLIKSPDRLKSIKSIVQEMSETKMGASLRILEFLQERNYL